MRISLIVGLVLVTTVLNAVPLRVGVSVLPLESVVGALGGEWVEVQSLQREGDSCSVFEPRPSSISWLAQADLFFRTGVGYESVIMEKIRARFGNLTVLDLRESVTLLGEVAHHHHDHGHNHGHDHSEAADACGACAGGGDSADPHIWMDPQSLARMAGFISAELGKAMPEHADELAERLKAFQDRCAALDERIASLLEPYAGRSFYIYHPTLAYFADRYGLRQIAIAGNGASPTARELHERIVDARQSKVGVIFVQPQESRRHAEIIAEAIGARIVEIDPMAMDWEANLLEIAQALRAGFDQ